MSGALKCNSDYDGEHHGGQTCEEADCPEPPPGNRACCYPDGQCFDLEILTCIERAGAPYEDEICADIECPLPAGACCRADDSCDDNVFEMDCYGAGETHHPGLPCSVVSCDSGAIIVDTLDGPEGLTELPPAPDGGQYYEFEDVGIKVAFAGGSFNIHSIGTGAALFEDIGEYPFYGVFPMMIPNVGDAMMAFGPNGWEQHDYYLDPPNSRFIAPLRSPIGNVTDAYRPPEPVGGLDYDGHFLAVSYSERQVLMYEWSTDFDRWEGTQMNASFFTYDDESETDYSPISAWSAFDGFVIVAMTLEPSADSNYAGELWYGDYASEFTHASSVFVGELGVNPRRIRCLSGVCAVSSWRDGYLTLISWPDTSEPPAITDRQIVGNGPVGIDLIEDGSNVLVVSTGYNDNTYAITTVASDGSVVSSETLYAPDGCTAPGHAIWIEDGGTKKVVLSCNTSNNYAVFDPNDM